MKKPNRIVVVQGAWVLVGTAAASTLPNCICLTHAAVVRRWGTTRGLGELALNGQRPETILDPVGTADIPTSQILMQLHVVSENWEY